MVIYNFDLKNDNFHKKLCDHLINKGKQSGVTGIVGSVNSNNTNKTFS